MVPFTLKQKIKNGKNVYMWDLIEMNKPAELCKLTVQNGFDGVPSLVYMPSKKKTLSHSEYSYGWLMYKSVYLESHPNEVNGMLAFENNICNFAR